MRFLHLGDLHIGKTVNGFSMLDDQRHVFQQILDLADARKVDGIVIAGDLYDKSQPTAEAVKLLDWLLSCIAKRDIFCCIVPGNHDSADRVAYGGSLFQESGVFVAPVFDGTVSSCEFSDEYGKVVMWLIPYLKPLSVRHFFPEAEIGSDYSAALKTVLDGCAVDSSARNVAIAHQFVTMGSSSPETSDSELFMGGMDNVDGHLFDAFDYVALGHIHRPQRVGRETMRYSGSPLCYSFSEARVAFGGSKTDKSVPLVTLGEKGDVEVELLPLHPLRAMRTVKGPLADVVSCTAEDASGRDDYVHVVLTDDVLPQDVLQQVRNAFPNMMQLSYDNSETRAREEAAGIDGLGDVSLDPHALFCSFFEAVNGGGTLSDSKKRIAFDELDRAFENEAEGEGE